MAPRASADERQPQVFNTASHFVFAMLSLLGAAELIVKASEQARGVRRVPRAQGGWRAPRALAAAPGRRGLVERTRALWWCCAARRGACRRSLGAKATLLRLSDARLRCAHSRRPTRAVPAVENCRLLHLRLHPREPVRVLHAAPRARGAAGDGARPPYRRLLRDLPADCRRVLAGFICFAHACALTRWLPGQAPSHRLCWCSSITAAWVGPFWARCGF